MNAATSRPKELGWERNPAPELVRLAWPIAVSMLSYSVMTLVDTLFVGWLGSAALAGVGLAGTMMFALLCFPFGLLRASKVLISQSVGDGKSQEVGAYLAAALLLAAGLGVVGLAVGALVSMALPELASTEAAARASTDYFDVRMLSLPIALACIALREARYGVGDSRSPMVATLSANAVNVGLNYLFIFPLGMGVAGAAWGSNAAFLFEALLLVWLRRGEPFDLYRVRFGHIVALWRLGLPAGLQFLLEIGSFALLAAMISRMSEAAMAAHQIALQIIHFSFLPAVAISDAASVLIGQAIGARREDLVRPLARQALVGAIAYTGFCSLVIAIGAPWLVRGFTKEAELAIVAVHLLYVAALFQVFDGAYIVARGALRGVGDVRYPAVVGVIVAWVCTPPLAWLLGYVAGWGAVGGWIGLCLELTVGAAILWVRLERGGWREAAERARSDREAATANPKLAEQEG